MTNKQTGRTRRAASEERLRGLVIECRDRGDDAVMFAMSDPRASKFLTNDERAEFARRRHLLEREAVSRDLAQLESLNRAVRAYKT